LQKKVWILSVVIIFLSLGGYFYLSNDRRQSLPTLGSDLKANLVGWVQEHYLSPEEYVLSKFQEHDFVFLGEHHRILHDVELIQALIPLLFENGIYHLGIEFANFADQELIDELIAAPTYDQDLAYEIQFRQWPFWGYKEYIDIFRVAWQVNQRRTPGTPAFRVVGLNAINDFGYLTSETDRSDPEVAGKISPQGDSDTFMARVILDEFARPGHKALIYMGINHAYTRYYQPVYNEQTGDAVHLMRNRAGNLVYREVGDRAFTIFLHAPWPSKDGYGEQNVYPVDGVIDALISELPQELRRAGFDVRGTPFGDLTSMGTNNSR